ncbi:F-box protein [Actinidia chinensis var. chinensis]|uniref:F-box protein n=1 Tax=Actinidia chinensis var. chinensis TaxID=1590841 RepID=A0A2R6QL84_ACTCC|nr:F-box protein [Actinidia chinensis var. chinensis]
MSSGLVTWFLFLSTLSSLCKTKRNTALITMVRKKRDGYNSEDGRTSKWCWSYLPVGVLGMIMGRLSPVDQIRFRAVCKDWRRASSSSQPSPRLPWLMTHDWVWSESGDIASSNKFHMPFHRHTHTSMHELDGQNWDDIHGASVCASKYGWLLLQKSKNGFVYNPFTREMLKLPKIDIAFNRITFSSVPTSTDCLFFAIESSKKSSRYKIKICICSLGAQKWTTKNFNGIGKVAEDVVYNNGIFYCVFSGGVLGTYNVALQDWKVLTGMAPITDVLFWHRAQMVDADGELLLVGSTNILHIFKFDRLQMTWVRINSLENHMLFLGCTSFAIAVSGGTSNLAGRVYFHSNVGTKFHCFRDHTSQRCFELYPWDTPHSLEKLWVEPPQF